MQLEPTASALMAAQARLNVSAHNIANMNTRGFKARQAVQRSSIDGRPTVDVKETDHPTDLVDELVNQRLASYDFKANVVMLKAKDEMTGQIINLEA